MIKVTGIIVFIVVFWNQNSILAQSTGNDFNLIVRQDPRKVEPHEHNVAFGITNRNPWYIKYNPITLGFSTLMFGYQKWISPQISANCYYEPTCSRYSVLLYKDLGIIRGTLATADRLMRCDRISATTFHPISINPVDGKIHESVARYHFKTGKSNE